MRNERGAILRGDDWNGTIVAGSPAQPESEDGSLSDEGLFQA